VSKEEFLAERILKLSAADQMMIRLIGWGGFVAAYAQAGADIPTCGIKNMYMFYCTREKGHPGPHVAHGGITQVCDVWDDIYETMG